MKCKIIFLLSVLTLLSLFSFEHYSFFESPKTYAEIEIDTVDEAEAEEEEEEEKDKKLYNLRLSYNTVKCNTGHSENLKLANFLCYGLYKPPKKKFS